MRLDMRHGVRTLRVQYRIRHGSRAPQNHLQDEEQEAEAAHGLTHVETGHTGRGALQTDHAR